MNYLEHEIEFPKDTLRLHQMNNDILKVDSLHEILVDSIIKIHGFIGGAGFPYQMSPFSLFMKHQPVWVLKNTKMLKKAIKQGKLLPADYAYCLDKSIVHFGAEYSFYGYFNNVDSSISPEVIFKRFNEIGLSPYYNENTNYYLPKAGEQPEKSTFHEYYSERKSRFRCY